MKTIYNTHTDKYGDTIMELYRQFPLYEKLDSIIRLGSIDSKFMFLSCFTNHGLLDVFFVNLLDKNYVVLCSRSYVYGQIDHWKINLIYEVNKEEGNELYIQVRNSKFTSKQSNKMFYKSTLI